MKIKLIAKIKDVIIGYIFDTDTNITIGREIGNTIAPIIDSISRHHAHIFFADGSWQVEDLNSTNGSLINGRKIEGKVLLKTGDSLRFGLIDMSVTLDQQQIASVPPPVVPALEPVAPAKPAAAIPALEPVEMEPVAELEPVTPTAAPAASPAGSPISPVAGIRKPVIGGMKPGIKLPTKPALPSGLKLPPKPAIKPGVKLPAKP